MTAGEPTTGRDDEVCDCGHPADRHLSLATTNRCAECPCPGYEPAPAAVADNAGEERHPCPHGCPGGHTEDGYYGGDCPHRDSEPFEGYRDEDGPRPAASPGAKADDYTSIMRAASHWGIDDGRTEELRAAMQVALHRHESGGAGDGCPACTARVDMLLSDPEVAPLLAATTGRGDDGAVQRVLALADELVGVARDYRHAAPGSHDAGARNAHQAIANRIRAAVAGGQDADT